MCLMQSKNNIPYSSTWFLYFCEINGLINAKKSGLSYIRPQNIELLLRVFLANKSFLKNLLTFCNGKNHWSLNQICDIQWESIAIESRGKNITINKNMKGCYGNSK